MTPKRLAAFAILTASLGSSGVARADTPAARDVRPIPTRHITATGGQLDLDITSDRAYGLLFDEPVSSMPASDALTVSVGEGKLVVMCTAPPGTTHSLMITAGSTHLVINFTVRKTSQHVQKVVIDRRPRSSTGRDHPMHVSPQDFARTFFQRVASRNAHDVRPMPPSLAPPERICVQARNRRDGGTAQFCDDAQGCAEARDRMLRDRRSYSHVSACEPLDWRPVRPSMAAARP